jgi:hypothetical protein
MTHTLFAGCSFTAGGGFTDGKNHPSLWVNQLHNRLFPHTNKLNIATGGRSNAGIFQDTIKALSTYSIKYAFVQWTSLIRFNMELGFELHDTYFTMVPHGKLSDHHYHNIKYSAKYLESIRNRLVTLPHDCYEIANLLEYTNSIVKLAEYTNTRVFFINGLVPWDNNFFDKKINVLPDRYTKYTQKILNTATRDNEQSCKLYDKMHDRFSNAGGIHKSTWLNLYESLLHLKVDANNDGIHPGIQSQNRYVELFLNNLEQDFIV